MGPLIGVILHAIGGFAAGSFYMPLKKVRNWSWENYWLVCGLFAWIIVPWIMHYLLVKNPTQVLLESPPKVMLVAYFFGVLWGIGGLMYGLTIRYLGMSLGVALALGCCAAFGTLVPPIVQGEIGTMFTSMGGIVTLVGVLACLGGIGICGIAGMFKESELSDDQKTATIEEFNFSKGVWVAIVAGIMSASFNFGLTAGKDIAALAIELGTREVLSNTPVFIFVMAGGFTTNVIWCLALAVRNKSLGDFVNTTGSPIAMNVVWSALGGLTWYCQFLFYGMGETKMGQFSFSSWTIHMALIILFGNMWGLVLREWRGSSRRTYWTVALGMLTIILSIAIIGLGGNLSNEVEVTAEAVALLK